MNTSAKKILKIASLSIFFLFIITYAFFSSYDLIFGVKIKNVNINGQNITDGAKVRERVIKVTGNAKNAINLNLNGREISVDQYGNFSEDIALGSGYNIISIKARDKFGNTDEKDYKLIYENNAKE